MSDHFNEVCARVPTLEGTKNWARWKSSLRCHLLVYEAGLWDFVIGRSLRPEHPPMQSSNNAVQAADSYYIPSSAALNARFGLSPMIWRETLPGWKRSDDLALAYIRGTISQAMAFHILHSRSAHEAFESLKTVCEAHLPTEAYYVALRWFTCKYVAGEDPRQFVIKWARLLADVKLTYPADQHVPELLSCHVFLNAVSKVPGFTGLSKGFLKDTSGFREPDLADLYQRFQLLEWSRSHADAHSKYHKKNDSSAVAKKKKWTFCKFHQRKAHHTAEDCYMNPDKANAGATD